MVDDIHVLPVATQAHLRPSLDRLTGRSDIDWYAVARTPEHQDADHPGEESALSESVHNLGFPRNGDTLAAALRLALKLRGQWPLAQGGGPADKRAGRRGNTILPYS